MGLAFYSASSSIGFLHIFSSWFVLVLIISRRNIVPDILSDVIFKIG